MKKSKQTKASKRVDDGVDIVSNLPDPILHLILSRLPTTEEVIRTSILSKRWRYLWTSIPSLDIDYSRGLNPIETFKRNKIKEYKFTEFVYSVLLNKSLNLDTFRLSCSYDYSMSTVGRWINAAVRRNVKQLHLVFRPENEDIEIPNCLVTCGSLEVLRLFLLKGRLSLPNFTGFFSLRVLELNEVQLFDANLVKAFFKSCPLLEDLSLIDCTMETLEFLCISCLNLKNLRINNRESACGNDYMCGDLQISCPKLVVLELTGTIAYNFFFDSLDSLKKAVIHPKVLDSKHMDNTVCELFAGISYVEFLSISISFIAKCIDPDLDVHISLPNLKALELTLDCAATNTVQFVKCFPDLESLHLNIIWDYSLLDYWKVNDAATMRILTRQLKKVEYYDYGGHYWQLDIACFFLKPGSALEEMVFRLDNDEATFHERSMETMNQVSKFHKASSTLKLIAVMNG